jgi:hypothetical protein
MKLSKSQYASTRARALQAIMEICAGLEHLRQAEEDQQRGADPADEIADQRQCFCNATEYLFNVPPTPGLHPRR